MSWGFWVGVLVAGCAMRAPGSRIPSLSWAPRSGWVNVKELGARGDAQTDDTAAIQKALASARNGSTIYLPPGTYKVTATLKLTGPLVGVSVMGHGRGTTLLWDGAPGGTVLTDDGVAYSRFVGIQFDGRGRAAVGFRHASFRRFETEVRHQHLAFRGFTDAAVLADPRDKYALAETSFENCLFEDCRRGVVFVSFNDYNYTFDGCEFRRCGTAIQCEHGNFYARNCHFEGSKVVDILARPEHGSSIRRCTSVGSAAFLHYANPVSPMTVQDCHVAAWRDEKGAIVLGGAPVLLFDCTFTGGPPDGESLKTASVTTGAKSGVTLTGLYSLRLCSLRPRSRQAGQALGSSYLHACSHERRCFSLGCCPQGSPASGPQATRPAVAWRTAIPGRL